MDVKSKDSDASVDSEKNHERINKAINEANNQIKNIFPQIAISSDTCFQLSNRVANAWWLSNQGIPVVLLNL